MSLQYSPWLSFFHDLLLPISSVVEVNGVDLDVRLTSVLVEQDSTTSEMGNVKVIREALVLEVFDRLLQSNDVPFLSDVFLDGTFFPPPNGIQL